MEIKDFIRGERPECSVPPHYKHTRVQGMGVAVPYCLWCERQLIKTLVIDTDKGGKYILHIGCNRKSYNANDIKYKYCGVCHTFPERISS